MHVGITVRNNKVTFICNTGGLTCDPSFVINVFICTYNVKKRPTYRSKTFAAFSLEFNLGSWPRTI